MKFKIMTDRAADCLEDEIEKYDLIMAEMPVSFDGEEADRAVFWNELMSGKVAKTSQPSREFFITEFEKAKEEGYQLLCVLISSALSGTFSSAQAVKKEVDYDGIYLIDSKMASVAEKQLVKKAAECREEGMSAAQTAEVLEEFKTHVKLFACIDSLAYLARGGRLASGTAAIGNLLHLKPIISINERGEIIVVGKKIGRNKSMAAMANLIGETDKIYPIYSYSGENCMEFVNRYLSVREGLQIEKEQPIGETIGAYIGPYGYGAVFIVS